MAVLEGFGPVRRALRIAQGQRATVSLTVQVSLRDEVVVTATKTGEADVQTTPMAITVLPGVDLARMGGSLGRADRGPRTFGHVLADRELGAIDYTRAGVVVGFDGLRLTL